MALIRQFNALNSSDAKYEVSSTFVRGAPCPFRGTFAIWEEWVPDLRPVSYRSIDSTKHDVSKAQAGNASLSRKIETLIKDISKQ